MKSRRRFWIENWVCYALLAAGASWMFQNTFLGFVFATTVFAIAYYCLIHEWRMEYSDI